MFIGIIVPKPNIERMQQARVGDIPYPEYNNIQCNSLHKVTRLFNQTKGCDCMVITGRSCLL